MSLRMTVRRKRISGWAVVLLLALATPAVAAEIIEAPVITPGVPGQEGLYSLFEASPGTWSPDGAEAAYAWLRCVPGGSDVDCTPIDGACGRRYIADRPDLGSTLRIRLTVEGASGSIASTSSAETVVIEEKPYSIPPEEQLPDSCTRVTPTGPNQGEFESGTKPEPQPEPILGPPGSGIVTRFIKPFPVVRVAGSFTFRSTTITRVTVRAPRGVRIGVQCRGRGCANRRRALTAGVRQVRSLARRYRPGAVLQIRVTRPNRIGKYVRLRVRSGRAPLRIDRCLMPEMKRAVRCPAA